MKKKTTEEIKKELETIYGNTIDYSKLVFEGSNKNFCLICPKHGEFWVSYDHIIHGEGCPFCKKEEKINEKWEEYIIKAKKIHGNKYDYVKNNFQNINSKIQIICPEHGEFLQTLNSHINSKQGCEKCYHMSQKGKYKITKEQFVEKAKEVHGDKYDYSKVKYVNNHTKVCIICPEHGEFWMEPSHHLLHMACPKCSTKRLEKEVENALIKNNIKYIWQANNKTFKWLNKQSLDFYLPEYNIAIECQGEQHFIPKAFFGGEKRFAEQLERDERKNNLCTIHNIKLIYFTHEKNTLYECINSVDKLLTIIKGG